MRIDHLVINYPAANSGVSKLAGNFHPNIESCCTNTSRKRLKTLIVPIFSGILECGNTILSGQI